MTSRRILLVTHEYPPLGGNGGIAMRHIARGLARLGHKPFVLTAAWKDEPLDEHDGDVVVRRLPSLRRSVERAHPDEIAAFMVMAAIKAPQLAKDWQIDVVLAFFAGSGGPIGWYLKRRCKLPFAVALQPGDVPDHTPGKEPQHRTFLRRVIDSTLKFVWRNADAVIANSDALAALARGHDAQVKVEVIPGGADVEGILPKDRYEPIGDVQLLYVGRLAKRKGLHVLLDALAKVPLALKWKLTLIGEGPEWASIAAQAARLALIDRIALHGWQGWEGMPEIYRNADVFVLPSYDEGMPTALLEAKATGLPVIGTRFAGMGEAILDGKTGMLVPPEDADALADALTQMIADPARWEMLGRAGRARVASYYSWTSVAQKWAGVIERIIAARGGAAR